jgi:inosine/xanthosine triphosphate pyrophosphatase family protein
MKPGLRTLFLTAQRQIRLYFYTSNLDKYLQARAVLDRFQLPLRYFLRQTEPYEEDYTKGKTELLKTAIREILGTLPQAPMFFVEDTSLRIDALSSGPNDFPGLAVKEWFASTSFADVDRLLKEHGDDRGAVVSSDIALHVPGRDDPVYFSGATRGVIASVVDTVNVQRLAHP